MVSRERSTRISFRCSRKETEQINKLALARNLSVSDLIRESIIIACSTADTPLHWAKILERALTKDLTTK